jgi:HEPN domain-containing protein
MATERDQARILLSKAAQDEALVRKVSSDTDIADELIGFHAQQAVEKSMKAVLAANGVKFPFIHDLGVLGELCEQAGAPLPAEVGDVAELTPYAGGLRYDEDTVGLVDRERALHLATAAVEWARSSIDGAPGQ